MAEPLGIAMLLGDGVSSLDIDTNEFPTLVTDAYIFLIVTGHIAASGAWRPILNEGVHIKAFLIFEANRGGNQFLATHATQVNFFGFGHFEPPPFCLSLFNRCST